MLLLKIAILILLGVPVTLLGANVLQDLWLWFLVPFGLQALGLFHAAGLMSVASLVKLGLAPMKIDGEDESPFVAGITRLILFSLMYLLTWGFAAIWARLGGLS